MGSEMCIRDSIYIGPCPPAKIMPPLPSPTKHANPRTVTALLSPANAKCVESVGWAKSTVFCPWTTRSLCIVGYPQRHGSYVQEILHSNHRTHFLFAPTSATIHSVNGCTLRTVLVMTFHAPTPSLAREHFVLAPHLATRLTGPLNLKQYVPPLIPTFHKSSSEDEIANMNVLRRHRTCRGQSLRPLN